MHAMLSMHSSMERDNWAEVLPRVQLAYNTSFNKIMHETPFFLMFGRQARLPADVILGIPHVGSSADTEMFTKTTRENLQMAYETRHVRTCLSEPPNKLHTTTSYRSFRCSNQGNKCYCVQTLPRLRRTKPKTALTVARAVHYLFAAVTSCVSSKTTQRNT